MLLDTELSEGLTLSAIGNATDLISQQSGTRVKTSTAAVSSRGGLVLDQPGNNLGVLELSVRSATLINSGALTFAGVSVLVALTLSSAGDISQTGTLLAPALGLSSTDVVVLNSAANDIGRLDFLVATSGLVVDTNSIQLRTILVTDSLTLSAGGMVNEIFDGDIIVGGELSVSTPSSIRLYQVGNSIATLAARGDAISVRSESDLALGDISSGSVLSLSVAANISSGGASSVQADSAWMLASGTLSLASNASLSIPSLSVTANSMTLHSASNHLGVLELSVANARLTNNGALTLAKSSVGGALTLSTGGDLSQSGALLLSVLGLSSTGVVVLNDPSNDIARIDFLTAASATVVVANALELQSVVVASNFSLSAGGSISEVYSGVIQVPGVLSLATPSGVVLHRFLIGANSVAANQVGTLHARALNLSLLEVGGLVLGSISVASVLQISVQGEINDMADAAVLAGSALISAMGAVSLDNGLNDFDSLRVDGSLVRLIDIDALTITRLSASGGVTIRTGGSTAGGLDIEGNLSYGGDLYISTAGSLSAAGRIFQNYVGDINNPAANRTIVLLATGDIALGNYLPDIYSRTSVTTPGNLSIAGAQTGTPAKGASYIEMSAKNAELRNIWALFGGDISIQGDLVVSVLTELTNAQANWVENPGEGRFLVGGNATLTIPAPVANLVAPLISIVPRNSNSVSVGGELLLDIGAGNAIPNRFTANLGDLQVNLRARSSQVLLTAIAGDLSVQSDSGLILGADVLLSASGALVLPVRLYSANNLTAFAGTSVTAAGAVQVRGESRLTAEQGLVLDNANNDFAVLYASGSSLTLMEANALNLGQISVADALVLRAGDRLSQRVGTSVLAPTATLSTGERLVLDSVLNDFNSLSLLATVGVTLSNSDTLTLGTLSTGGDLTLMTGGALTIPGNVTYGGDLYISAGGSLFASSNLYHSYQGNEYDLLANKSATLLAAGDISLQQLMPDIYTRLSVTAESGSVSIDNSGLAGTLARVPYKGIQYLELRADNAYLNTFGLYIGAIDVSGQLTVISRSHLTNEKATFIPNPGSGNVLVGGRVLLQNTNAAFNEPDRIINIIGRADNTVSIGGVLALETGAGLSATKFVANAGNLSVELRNIASGTLSLTALVGNLSVWTDYGVTLSVASYLLADGAVVFSNGFHSSDDLYAWAEGSIADNAIGTPVKIAGTTSLSAGQTIVLDGASNDFGTLHALANTITLVDTNALVVGDLSASVLRIEVGGDLVGTASTSVLAGEALLSVSGALVLDSPVHDFDRLALSIEGSAMLVDSDDVTLMESRLRSDLMLSAGGDISQIGRLGVIVQADAHLSTPADIVLTNSLNNFAALYAQAFMVTLADVNGLMLGNVVVSALTLSANGAVGAVSGTSVSATEAVLSVLGSLVLDGPGNNLGTLYAQASQAVLVDTDALQLGDISLWGDLNLTAGEMSVVWDRVRYWPIPRSYRAWGGWYWHRQPWPPTCRCWPQATSARPGC